MGSLFTVALLALAAATRVVAVPFSAPAAELTPRDNTAVIIGTFEDHSCSAGQRDWSDAVSEPPAPGSCDTLPGQSAKVWWVKKGCLALMFKNSNCQGQPTTISTPDECIDIKGFYSWEAYCQ